MVIIHPTYLIAELAGDVVTLVKELRSHFNPNHNWPVDITIAGSSGIGTIKEGQNTNDVIKTFQPIIDLLGFSQVNFTGISRFPNTGIYHLVPERRLFDRLHNAIATSGIIFNENIWPYNPHCTLRAGQEQTQKCDELFKSMAIPDDVTIECFSLYQPFSGNGRVYKF